MPGSYTSGAEWIAAVFLLRGPRRKQHTAPRGWTDPPIVSLVPRLPGEHRRPGEIDSLRKSRMSRMRLFYIAQSRRGHQIKGFRAALRNAKKPHAAHAAFAQAV
ncbi:hypothetical protein B0H13DRAFT_1858947 [Mycena leptocephala]|nr:hypothetical protein B0H13DRAFT_1858947 [Mycena leptocephala]